MKLFPNMSLGNDCHQSFCEHIYSAGRMVENQKHDILNLVTTKCPNNCWAPLGSTRADACSYSHHPTATTIVRYSYML